MTAAKRKRFGLLLCGMILFSCLALVLFMYGKEELSPNKQVPNGITAPNFPVTGETMQNATFHGDVGALSRQLEVDTALLYYEPQGVSLTTLKTNLEMPSKGVTGTGGSVVYNGADYVLSVYPGGAFTLQFTGTEDAESRHISHQDYKDIAAGFLEINGLLCEELTVNTHLYDTKSSEKGTVTSAKAVEFFDSTRLGDVGVTVEIDGAGTVRRLTYEHVHYTKSTEVSLISVAQAYRFMEKHKTDNGKLLLDLPTSAPGKLTVETVELGYYETVAQGDTPASLQPVYIFRGKATVGKGQGAFSISVPAVDY